MKLNFTPLKIFDVKGIVERGWPLEGQRSSYNILKIVLEESIKAALTQEDLAQQQTNREKERAGRTRKQSIVALFKKEKPLTADGRITGLQTEAILLAEQKNAALIDALGKFLFCQGFVLTVLPTFDADMAKNIELVKKQIIEQVRDGRLTLDTLTKAVLAYLEDPELSLSVNKKVADAAKIVGTNVNLAGSNKQLETALRTALNAELHLATKLPDTAPAEGSRSEGGLVVAFRGGEDEKHTELAQQMLRVLMLKGFLKVKQDGPITTMILRDKDGENIEYKLAAKVGPKDFKADSLDQLLVAALKVYGKDLVDSPFVNKDMVTEFVNSDVVAPKDRSDINLSKLFAASVKDTKLASPKAAVQFTKPASPKASPKTMATPSPFSFGEEVERAETPSSPKRKSVDATGEVADEATSYALSKDITMWIYPDIGEGIQETVAFDGKNLDIISRTDDEIKYYDESGSVGSIVLNEKTGEWEHADMNEALSTPTGSQGSSRKGSFDESDDFNYQEIDGTQQADLKLDGNGDPEIILYKYQGGQKIIGKFDEQGNATYYDVSKVSGKRIECTKQGSGEKFILANENGEWKETVGSPKALRD